MPQEALVTELLRKLGAQVPSKVPEVSPEQRLLHEELVKRQQQLDPGWKKLVRGGLQVVPDVAKGLVADPAMPRVEFDQTSPAQKFGMLGAALPFGPKGIKGLYSRVEKIAESLPNQIHPNKLGTILRNRASQEEVQWRGIDRLMQQAGNKPIAKEAVVRQLQEQPLDVKIVEKGKPARLSDGDVFEPGPYIARELDTTQYDGYQMPGASNYRETLIQLGPKGPVAGGTDPLAAGMYGPDLFTSHHWDEPNVLVHVRHNEREIPPRPQFTFDYGRSPASFENKGSYQGVIRRLNPNTGIGDDVASVYPRIPVGTPGAVPELRGHGDDIIHQLMQQSPPSSKGRMLENVQSDWHQRGAHSGYLTEPGVNPAAGESIAALHEAQNTYMAKLQDAAKAIDEWHTDYAEVPEDILRQEDVNFIWNRLAKEKDDALAQGGSADARYQQLVAIQNDLRQAQVARDNANDLARRAADAGVPDAPFKDTWAELALKQQLMDVADRPDLEWLGIAPSSELRARGEVISPEFQDKQLPRTLEKLLSGVGGKVERADLGFKPHRIDAYWDPAIGPQGGFRTGNLGPGPYNTPIFSFLNSPKQEELDAVRNTLQNQGPNIQAFIARLTPEMKERIKKEGFPLLTLLMMMQQQEDQSSAR